MSSAVRRSRLTRRSSVAVATSAIAVRKSSVKEWLVAMGQSIAAADRSTRVDSIDSVRPTPAKAELRVNASQSTLTGVVAEALRVSEGSQKAAAIAMGIDQAQLTRQLQNQHLTLERLEALGPRFFAELARQLDAEFRREAESPAQRLRRHVRHLRQVLDDLDDLTEEVA